MGFLVDAGPAELPPSGDIFCWFAFVNFLLICDTDKVTGVYISWIVYLDIDVLQFCAGDWHPVDFFDALFDSLLHPEVNCEGESKTVF